MQDILFKAKHLALDKWYEGYYVKMGRLHYLCVVDGADEYKLVEIDP